MNIRVTRFYLKSALKSLRDHVSDCFCLSSSLRPSSPSPPWPRTCPSVTLCPCQRMRLSTATTRNGWCRRTFRWQLPSDRASRPSMCTQATPPTDKVGLTVHARTHYGCFYHCLHTLLPCMLMWSWATPPHPPHLLSVTVLVVSDGCPLHFMCFLQSSQWLTYTGWHLLCRFTFVFYKDICSWRVSLKAHS